MPSKRTMTVLLVLAGAYGGLAAWASQRFDLGPVGLLLAAVIAAPLLLLVLMSMDRRERRRIGLERRGFLRLRPSARAIVECDQPAEAALDLARRALGSVPGASVEPPDARGFVTASVAGSDKSFGEQMEVRAEAAAIGSSITVTSRPAMRTTLLDYGKNDENVQSFLEAFERLRR